MVYFTCVSICHTVSALGACINQRFCYFYELKMSPTCVSIECALCIANGYENGAWISNNTRSFVQISYTSCTNTTWNYRRKRETHFLTPYPSALSIINYHYFWYKLCEDKPEVIIIIIAATIEGRLYVMSFSSWLKRGKIQISKLKHN